MVIRSSFLVIALGVTAWAAMVAGALAQAPAKVADNKPAQAENSDEAAIRASANAYEKAFDAGDAKAVADFWTKDGEFIDEQGREFVGRDAIEKEFAAIFASQPGAKIEITIDSIKFLTPEVAIERGTTRAQSDNQAAGAPVTYSVVHVKQDGQWLMSNVNESRPAAANGARDLASISWLIGEWEADLGKDKTYHMTCHWTLDKSFLMRTFTVTEGDERKSEGTQFIGWNPVLGQIVSWTFDSAGGFGYELWEDRGTEWHIDASSVLADRSTALATNRLTKIDDNAFLWQSLGRSINGQSLPDTAEVRVKRISE